MRATYLGSELSPQDYYRLRAGDYNNEHADGIRYVINRHRHWLSGTLLDMGCGSGLATSMLWASQEPIIGVDAEPAMIERYQKETGHPGLVANFWDELPFAESAIFCYSLHLCPRSRVASVAFRLIEAGVTQIVVVSPFKARAEDWTGFHCVENTSDGVGPDEKTIHGRVYLRNQ